MVRRALALLALLALAGLQGARAEACPATCACGEADGEREYDCQGFSVRGQRDDFAKITCHDDTFSCDAMPLFPLSNNGTLSSVSLTACPLPASLRCVLARLGAAGTRHLVLDGVKGRLTAEHVRGLGEVTMLMMLKAGDVTEIPYDVLAALPSLRDFRIREAHLRLPALELGGASDGSGGPGGASDGSGGPGAVSDGSGGAAGAVDGPLPPLKFVELSSDGISGLPAGSLSRFSEVPQLHLWDNHIENITAESFRGLSELQSLDLSRNPLRRLPALAEHAPRMRELVLVATRLQELPEGTLRGLTQLETILIKFGQAPTPLELGARAFADLPSLKKLTIDNTPLEPLPPDLLATTPPNISALEHLVVTSCGLKALPTGFFDGLVGLQILNLAGNGLTELASDVFRPLKALKELNLNDNRIEELPEHLLAGLRQLAWVSAERNGLARVAASSVRGASALRSVSLAHNRLTLEPGPPGDRYSEARTSPFASLFALRSLVLRDNAIREVFSDWRYSLLALEELDLKGNNFTELSKADVQFLSASVVVDLRHNRIARVDVLEAPRWWPPPAAAAAAAAILLDHNPFRCDCDLFAFVRRLRGSRPLAAEPRLDVGEATCSYPDNLKQTRLKDLTEHRLTCSLKDNDCPEKCVCDIRPATSSVELTCDEEPATYPVPADFGLVQTRLRLRSAPDASSSLPEHVTSLNLSGVGITRCPDLPSTVREVDLSDNELVNPPGLLTRNLTVSLGGNPFVCDCSHMEDVDLLQENVGKIVDYENVTCNRGESPWRVDARRLCDVRRAALLGGTLAALGLIVALLAALTYRYSLEIRVFLFSRGWCLKLIHEEEFDQNLQYDAFVSFSQKDARWVAEELVPRLENAPHQLKLCVHYRDWLVGDMIPAQIARSVEQSRRTIVVLSKNFLESSWAPLEFRAAHLRSQRERRARVLVVVLEEMPPECEMDAELRAYLSTNTYLKWGDPWFWEKLVYALPHTRASGGVDKLRMGGLATRLNSDGMIVNDALKAGDTRVNKF